MKVTAVFYMCDGCFIEVEEEVYKKKWTLSASPYKEDKHYCPECAEEHRPYIEFRKALAREYN